MHTHTIPFTARLSVLSAAVVLSAASGCGSPSASDGDTTESAASSEATTDDTTTDDTTTDDTTTDDTTTDDTTTTGDGDGDGDGDGVIEPDGTSVLVQVLDTNDVPLAQASVIVDGVRHFTGGGGYILFDGLPDGRFTARIDAEGHTGAALGFEVGVGSHVHRRVRLFPLGPALVFDAELGADLEFDGVRVRIPPYVLINRQGQRVSGEVTATITSFDPSSSDLADRPGPLEALDDANEDVLLLSTAMAEISLWQDGRPLQLAPGALATIELDVPPALAQNYQVGDTIPAWWLDLDSGRWQREHHGTIVADEDDPQTLIWRASVGHFTWWNADWPAQLSECHTVTVVDQDNNPLPGLWFESVSALTDPALADELGEPLGFFGDGGTTADTTMNVGDNCIVTQFGVGPQIDVWGLNLSQQFPPGPGIPGRCRVDDVCNPLTLVVDLSPPQICPPGAAQVCGYAGPPGTAGVGICRSSVSWCIDGGTAWSECTPEVTPAVEEDCFTPFDDDCDTQVNEGCDCGLGPQIPCYGGPEGTELVPPCMAGTMSCDVILQEYTGECVGDVVPTFEICGNLIDENCNGDLGCAGNGLWALNSQGILLGEGDSLDVGPQGDVFTVGVFEGTTQFGPAELQSFGASDIFVTKQDSGGEIVWAKSFGGVGVDVAPSVTIDGSGNFIVAGVMYSDLSIDGSNLVAAGGGDILVAKFDANGVQQWSTSLGGPGFDGAFAVTTDAFGQVFVVGTSSGDVFPGAPGVGSSDAFVAAFDGNDGTLSWAKVFGGTSATLLDVEVKSNGNVVAAGYFNQSIDCGGGDLLSAGGTDIMIVELDAAAGYEHEWSARFGGPLTDAANGIAIDTSTDDIYLAGRYTELGVDFGGGQLPGGGVRNIFVAALDANGGHRWSRGWGGPGLDDALGVAFGAGGVVFTGRFAGSVDFGGGVLDSVDNTHDIMLVKLGSDGTFEWGHRFGGAGDDIGRAVSADLTSVYLTGQFSGEVDFGTGLLMNAGGIDAVIAKYLP